MEPQIHYHCSYLAGLVLWDYLATHQIPSRTERVSSFPSLSKLITLSAIKAFGIQTRHPSCHRSMSSPDSYVCGILCSQADFGETLHHLNGTAFVMACYWWQSSVRASRKHLLSLARAVPFSVSDSFDWLFARGLSVVCGLLNYAELLWAVRRGTSWWDQPALILKVSFSLLF